MRAKRGAPTTDEHLFPSGRWVRGAFLELSTPHPQSLSPLRGEGGPARQCGRAHLSFLQSHKARWTGDGSVSHPWLTWSRASSPAGRAVKFCGTLEVPFTLPPVRPGPGGKDDTLHGRQNACRHGRCKKLRCARCSSIRDQPGPRLQRSFIRACAEGYILRGGYKKKGPLLPTGPLNWSMPGWRCLRHRDRDGKW